MNMLVFVLPEQELPCQIVHNNETGPGDFKIIRLRCSADTPDPAPNYIVDSMRTGRQISHRIVDNIRTGPGDFSSVLSYAHRKICPSVKDIV